MKIGYISTQNPYTDKKAWSGSIYKTREAIENAGLEVEWIKISPPGYLIKFFKGLLKLKYGFTQNHPWIYKLLAKFTDWESAN